MIVPEEKPRKNTKGRRHLHSGSVAVCIMTAALLLVLLPASGRAHPPKEVALSYDQAQKTLEVRITHGVSDPAKHFIEKVEIGKAGKAISKTEYKSQPGEATFVYSYPLVAAPGDVIEVKAACSIFGSKTEKLTVGK